MATKQESASSLKSGNYVVMEGKACVVKNIQISRTGKHGHAKCRIEAVSLVENQKIIKIIPGHDKVEVPIIEKKNAQVLSVNGDVANVMDVENYETFDLKIAPEYKGDIIEGSQVSYWIILGEKVLKKGK